MNNHRVKKTEKKKETCWEEPAKLGIHNVK